MAPTPFIAPARAEHREAIRALSAAAFGRGYDALTRAEALVAQVEGTVVGFADGACPVGLSEVVYAAAGALRARIGEGEAIGVVGSVAVDPAWRARGVGSALLDALVSRLQARGCRCLLARAWVHPDGVVPSARLLERAGFREALRAPTLWREAQARQGFGCAQCDPNPCRCGAVIYLRAC